MRKRVMVTEGAGFLGKAASLQGGLRNTVAYFAYMLETAAETPVLDGDAVSPEGTC